MSDSLVSPDGMTPAVSEDISSTAAEEMVENSEQDFESQWGFPLPELYKLSLTFFKEKEGKAFHLSYRDKVQLVAYVRQITNGRYDPTNSPPVGYLDVVGNDRRKQWQELGDMSKESAMLEFCLHLNKTCTQLKPYTEAHRREKEEQERKRREEEERRRLEEEERERQRLEEAERRKVEEEKQRQEQERLQFKEAIYKQLLPQLQPIVQQQYPDSPQQQQVFLQQLQERYYQEYLQQLQQQQTKMEQQGDSPVTGSSMEASISSTTGDLEQGLTNLQLSNQVQAPNGDVNREESDQLPDRQSLPEIAKPSCWTVEDSKEFKDKLAKDAEGMIRVGHGETVTVRVPTHEEGNSIFWEFATDYCDIGFGLYFEWTVAPSNAISVHVSDSSEEDELDEDEDGKTDPERGTKETGPPIDEIIPIYRRDSHQKKFCGSHRYPGQGVYLLKFDNSYSLFRAKSLYYKVYYTRDDR